MSPDFLVRLDAHWAAFLRCRPGDLHSKTNHFISDPARTGAVVCLLDKTCIIAAAPPIAAALRQSVGTRNPAQAFEPSRLRAATADFALPLRGPEAVLVAEAPSGRCSGIYWITCGEAVPEFESELNRADGIPMCSIPLYRRAARRAAEACGFHLYASVIYLGERTTP